MRNLAHIQEKVRIFAGLKQTMDMQTSFLAILGLIALAVVLLSVRVILKKNGRFSSQHLSQSAAMRERGIGCVQSEDRKERQKADKKLNVSQL